MTDYLWIASLSSALIFVSSQLENSSIENCLDFVLDLSIVLIGLLLRLATVTAVCVSLSSWQFSHQQSSQRFFQNFFVFVIWTTTFGLCNWSWTFVTPEVQHVNVAGCSCSCSFSTRCASCFCCWSHRVCVLWIRSNHDKNFVPKTPSEWEMLFMPRYFCTNARKLKAARLLAGVETFNARLILERVPFPGFLCTQHTFFSQKSKHMSNNIFLWLIINFLTAT